MSFIAVGVTIAAVGAVGSAYAQNKAAGAQQRAANLQNKRERLSALRAMRAAQRQNEVQGVGSGTGGGSTNVGAAGAVASKAASAIGGQMMLMANAQDASKWNSYATGFGAMQSVGNLIATNSAALNDKFGGKT
jgi:hypothetical protein